MRKLANEIAKSSNKEIEIAKHKITCLTVLVIIFALLGTSIAIYSIHSLKELFYDMQIEENSTTTNDIEQNTGDGSGSNYYLNDSNSNTLGG